jgi:hypothetical protein
LILEGWGVSVNWKEVSGSDWAHLVDWLTDNIHNSSKSCGTNWNGDGASSVINLLSPDQTLGRIESDSSDVVATQMLSDF